MTENNADGGRAAAENQVLLSTLTARGPVACWVPESLVEKGRQALADALAAAGLAHAGIVVQPQAEQAGTGETPASADSESSAHCDFSRREDRRHSWRFDGDDPYVICVYCDEMQDALNGRVIRPGRRQPAEVVK